MLVANIEPLTSAEKARFATERPERSITASYHVEYFDRGYWHTESEHACEAHAKHREGRFYLYASGTNDRVPTRVVKVTTATERRVIE